jgi:H+-transporting ATPase
VDAFSQVFPEDKFNVVALLQRKNQIVGMTGDGINDCPALRQADIGIAVHGAAPACLAAADMILRHPQLNVIKDAILLCRMSVERLRNYLFFRINCTTVILFWSFFGALQVRLLLLLLLVCFILKKKKR